MHFMLVAHINCPAMLLLLLLLLVLLLLLHAPDAVAAAISIAGNANTLYPGCFSMKRILNWQRLLQQLSQPLSCDISISLLALRY
jgi:hypothetical protein